MRRIQSSVSSPPPFGTTGNLSQAKLPRHLFSLSLKTNLSQAKITTTSLIFVIVGKISKDVEGYVLTYALSQNQNRSTTATK